MRNRTMLLGVLCTIGFIGRTTLPGQPPGQATGAEAKPEALAHAEKQLLPPPKQQELKQAEKAVDEVFARDVAKAKMASEKSNLAQELLKTAREEKDPASRWVLAQRAKQLAVQAQDAKLAVQAVEVLAAFEPADGPIPAKEAACRAHGLWAKGELARGQERLARWIEAAELYLRALDDLEGFEKAIAERRLKELGWDPRRFLPPQKVVEMFKIPNATINGGEIIWDSKREWLMTVVPGRLPIDFGFEINAARDHVIRIYVENKGYSFVRGPEGKSESWRHTDFHGPYRPVLLDHKGIEPGWHSIRIVTHNGKVIVYYDGEVVDRIDLPSMTTQNPIIKVGFGDHQCKAAIRRVYLNFAAP